MEGTNPAQVNNAERQLSSIKSVFENQNDLSFSLFQHMPIGICVTDSKGYFTDVNASYCDIYGYTKPFYKELLTIYKGLFSVAFTATILGLPIKRFYLMLLLPKN